MVLGLPWFGKTAPAPTTAVVNPNEGEPTEGPWHVTDPDGWLPADVGKYWNYWQMGFDPINGSSGSAVVEACVSAYAQTIAQCPGDHWRTLPNGGRERVTTSALSRLLRWPNDYQSRSDFILNMVRHLYLTGNSYHYAFRNDRYEVASLHPFEPGQSKPEIKEGNIFYSLGGNNILEPKSTKPMLVPARDVLHIKLEMEKGQPLVGVPPLRHASIAAQAQNAIASHLLSTFANSNRPAGVVETDKLLSEPQITQLRKLLNKQWSSIDNLGGGPPILTAGMKFHGVSMSAKDGEMAAASKLTQDEIFMVFGVPPAILGMTSSGTFSSTEALMQFWLSRGLGFAINHVEVAFDHFFNLKGWPDEYVEFDTRALLRVAYKDRVEALARGVQTAIYTPNEARRAEDLPDKTGGDEPRVQQQQVPLDWGGFEVDPTAPAPPAPGAPPAPAEDDEEDPPKPEEDDAKKEPRGYEVALRQILRGRADATA